MTITLDDKLAEEALVAASLAGSKELVVGLLKAGVKAGSTRGAALVVAEFKGYDELAAIIRDKMRQENALIPDWKSPKFTL